MLNWLTSRLNSASDDSNHPLGRDKSIDAFLAELPTVDPLRTLHELVDWLGDPAGLVDSMPLHRAVKAVERLDEFAQEVVSGCWSGLLAEALANHSIQHAAGTLKAYFTGSHGCNRLLLERLAAAPEHNDDKRLLAKFAARAMFNWVQLKKLGRMAYHTAEPAWWSEAHSLLALARDLGVAHATLNIYPQHQLLSSIWKEYQIGLLFETAPLTNLTVNEIDATDRLVRWVEPHSRFVDIHSDQTPFCILPEGSNMPARWQEDGIYGLDTRHFGIGQGQAQLAQLNVAITKDQKLPAWLAASGCNRQQVLQLLQKLLTNWSATPPSRRHPRLSAKGTIRVVNGLDMVRRMIAASEFAKSGRDLDYDNYLKNFHARHRDHAVVTETPLSAPKTQLEVLRLLETAGDQQMMEHWEIIDLSRGGMGVRFNARRPWQRIGALMAYRMEDELNWRVAVVRRLGSSHGRPNAGLTCFGGTPVCSQVRLDMKVPELDTWNQRAPDSGTGGWHNAVLLSAEAKLILMPTGLFSPSRLVHLSLQGVWHPVRLLKLHGRGADYDLISFLEEGAAPPQE